MSKKPNKNKHEDKQQSLMDIANLSSNKSQAGQVKNKEKKISDADKSGKDYVPKNNVSSDNPLLKSENKNKDGYIDDVVSELKRVTWPTGGDVVKWSIVVFCVLVFFALLCFVLDDFVVTPILYAISSISA